MDIGRAKGFFCSNVRMHSVPSVTLPGLHSGVYVEINNYGQPKPWIQSKQNKKLKPDFAVNTIL